MIRIIVTTTDFGAAANVGGPVHVWHKTFDVEAPEVEAFMSERLNNYQHRTLVGVEVLSEEPGQ